VVVPVADQAAQQVGTPQERRVARCRTTEDEVVAAAGAGVTPVDHELLAGQARLTRRLVEEFAALDQLVPAGRRVDVHLDHARVGSDAEVLQARVQRRFVALQQHRAAQLGSHRLDGRDQLQVVLQMRQRRHEQIQAALARFGAQRGTHDAGSRLPAGRTHALRAITDCP